jgi:hypothetical protein
MKPVKWTARFPALIGALISALISALIGVLIVPVLLSGCTKSGEDGKLDTPPTVFDPTVPDPRSDDQKIADFVVKLERKYKREEIRNDVDLHFFSNSHGRVKIRLTYSREADPTTAASIADAAVALAKRLKREDPSVRGLDIAFDREIVRREE